LPKLETKANLRGRTKQRPGHNLLERPKAFKTETLRLLTDFDVPFTNNLAEFRTLDGAQIFAGLRSVVSTARKQGCNILQTLTAVPSQIMLALTA
jgi:transposase